VEGDQDTLLADVRVMESASLLNGDTLGMRSRGCGWRMTSAETESTSV
jgi:hypothetical protein